MSVAGSAIESVDFALAAYREEGVWQVAELTSQRSGDSGFAAAGAPGDRHTPRHRSSRPEQAITDVATEKAVEKAKLPAGKTLVAGFLAGGVFFLLTATSLGTTRVGATLVTRPGPRVRSARPRESAWYADPP